MRTENNISINDELLVRYLAGEATPEEALALDDWVQVIANREYLDNLKATWYATRPASAPGVVLAGKAWEAFQEKMEDGPAIKRAAGPSMLLKIAASLLLVLTTALLLYIRYDSPDRPVAIALVTTDSVKLVSLPDGSMATLNRNTMMEYPEQFSDNLRQIKLASGEVFFSITPDKQKPFIIQTSSATIRVVGTSFNVVATKENLEVSVAEGKVMVFNEKDTTFVHPGMTALLYHGQNHITVKDSADANNWGYATGRFVFTDTPLRDVIATLEKAYECVITTTNRDLENCRVNGTFTNDSIENIVHLIAESMTLSVTKNGSVFILEGKGCP